MFIDPWHPGSALSMIIEICCIFESSSLYWIKNVVRYLSLFWRGISMKGDAINEKCFRNFIGLNNIFLIFPLALIFGTDQNWPNPPVTRFRWKWYCMKAPERNCKKSWMRFKSEIKNCIKLHMSFFHWRSFLGPTKIGQIRLWRDLGENGTISKRLKEI